MESKANSNNYPTIFIHGFLGSGPDNYFSAIYKYFGSFSKDLLSDLTKQGYEVYQPSLGPFNSLWCRCCYLYAYLVGGTVDFGKAHAERTGSERYGRTYPGVLKDWGKEGDHKKINLIGHSFGGPTVALFSTLLTVGSEEERAVTDPDDLSPLFKGGMGDLLHSVTTLDGTNNGTSATDFLGPTVRKVLDSVILGLGVTYNSTPFSKIFDFMNENYYLMDPPTNRSNKFINPFTKTKEIEHLATSEDAMFWQMSVEYTRELAKTFKTNPNTYYFAQSGITSHDGPFGLQLPDLTTNPIFPIPTVLFSLYQNKDLGIEGKEWKVSDGIVPLAGQKAPIGQPQVDFKPGMTFEPGVWYNMPPHHKDHQDWAGMWHNRADFEMSYATIMERQKNLPDA